MNSALHEIQLPSSKSSDVGMTTEICRTPEEFDKLHEEWDRLFQANGLSVFQSYEWQRTWWKYFGESNPHAVLHIVVVRSEREIIAVAPLFIEKISVFGVISVRRLGFIGREISDYLDFLFLAGEEHDAIGLVVDHLLSESVQFDVAAFEDITDRSKTAVLLANALQERGVQARAFVNEQCPRTKLLRTWDDTLASFQIDHRREIKRRRRNIEKAFRTEFEVAGNPSTISKDINEFMFMHQQRWTSSGQRGALSTATLQSFHRDVGSQCAQRGWVFLGFLRIDGKRFAASYGFKFRNELAIYLPGMLDDGTVRRYSPGRVLTSYCMEYAVTEGLDAFDFMRGTEQYKYEFEGVDIPNRTLMFLKSGSTLARRKYQLILLSHSLSRRANKELLLWKQVINKNGVFSRDSIQHFEQRLSAIFRDGFRKLQKPDQSVLVASRDSDEQREKTAGC
jgi:CelD/BcsL family acetyltransferase involved in cellulose biosynthesis